MDRGGWVPKAIASQVLPLPSLKDDDIKGKLAAIMYGSWKVVSERERERKRERKSYGKFPIDTPKVGFHIAQQSKGEAGEKKASLPKSPLLLVLRSSSSTEAATTSIRSNFDRDF